MPSKIRDIAEILGVTETSNTTNAALAIDGGGGSLTLYDSIGLLPLSGVDSGSMAFVNSNARMYINNGVGWYSATIVNNTPTWDSGGEPNTDYFITDSATPLVLNLSASDSEGIPITWTGVASDSASTFVTISNTDGTYTFTPIGSDSSGSFTYTFKASDGVNILSKLTTITYSPLTFITASNWTNIDQTGSTGSASQGVTNNGTWSWNSGTSTWSLSSQTATFSNLYSTPIPSSLMSGPFWIYSKYTGHGTTSTNRSAIGYMCFTDTNDPITNPSYASASRSC